MPAVIEVEGLTSLGLILGTAMVPEREFCVGVPTKLLRGLHDRWIYERGFNYNLKKDAFRTLPQGSESRLYRTYRDWRANCV